MAAALLLVAGLVAADAFAVPGGDTPAAKLAEWARDHGLGPVVTWLEQQAYEHDQPAVGGAPRGGVPRASGVVGPPATVAPVPALGGGTLPGEGRWQTVVQVRGRPAVQVASLRPDDRHTSYLVGILRMDPTLVRGQLRPGTTDPGGTWPEASRLTPPDQRTVAVAFNGGFRLTDPSHNGYFADGRTVDPLRPGAASLVLYRDGAAGVGAWGSEVHMGPDVASVRQNLLPLVDNGVVNPTCATGGTREWGSTVGQAAYINRSGFGVTAAGQEVYVGGPALSVCTLGRLLADAGVVRGMELDINPNWVTGTYYHDNPTGPPTGFLLFPGERTSPQHYLSSSSRDWFAWFVR